MDDATFREICWINTLPITTDWLLCSRQIFVTSPGLSNRNQLLSCLFQIIRKYLIQITFKREMKLKIAYENYCFYICDVHKLAVAIFDDVSTSLGIVTFISCFFQKLYFRKIFILIINFLQMLSNLFNLFNLFFSFK